MTSNNHSSNGNGTFSADVRLNMYVDDRKFEVASLGPKFGYFRQEQTIGSSDAEIETIVDNKITRWPIRITSELDGTTKRFEFEGVG